MFPPNLTIPRKVLAGLFCLTLFVAQPVATAAVIETSFSPEGSALPLVLKTITTAQKEVRVMGYSFTSPEVVRALINVRKRGVDVRVVLDHKANAGKQNKASRAAMNLLIGAGIPLRTVSAFKILHDKVIVADRRNTQLGSYNYSRAAESNSENVLVVWDDAVVAQHYLQHWTSRWDIGKEWRSSY